MKHTRGRYVIGRVRVVRNVARLEALENGKKGFTPTPKKMRRFNSRQRVHDVIHAQKLHQCKLINLHTLLTKGKGR